MAVGHVEECPADDDHGHVQFKPYTADDEQRRLIAEAQERARKAQQSKRGAQQ